MTRESVRDVIQVATLLEELAEQLALGAATTDDAAVACQLLAAELDEVLCRDT